ncbi:phosphonate ABC transporter, permease protein PhnE [Sabulicella rubraurantiaca]|uniref:phosphonate ABC transporter, permease protein PhnE n=1 Tax=Sabulicella rubraurantiaca TaxID=2811429 RepID=UPI001A95956F|nr:phosphonate ABC transporter, permease protein PhnE [Sabulicella rubraurantiaca]
MSAALRAAEAAFHERRRRRQASALLGGAVLLACFLAAARLAEFHPDTLLAGLPRIGEYFLRIAPELRWDSLLSASEMEGSLAFWFYRLDRWSLLLLETAQMAALATLLGAAAALPLSFASARNLGAPLARFLARRFLEAGRTVPEIVFALILIWAFGVGALPGILAIALHTAGALGRLFADAIENVPMRPWEGVRAAGGTWAEACRYAVLPAAAPDLLSHAILRFEVNIRSASVIGFVGAGGIGEELYQVISFNHYEEVSAIVLLIILAVIACDLLSERLRRRVIGA